MWRSFTEARAFVRALGLNKQANWKEYCKSGNRPNDIPSDPRAVYREWHSMRDWLGVRKECRHFEAAREFVKTLGLKNQMEWRAYCKSGNKPIDIPSNPDEIYTGDWVNFNDWLGNGKRIPGVTWDDLLPFDAAREFVRALGLKNQKAWKAYCTSGSKPSDIPSCPEVIYNEWVNLGDWLGTGRRRRFRRGTWLSFEEARAFVRGLGLKRYVDWVLYCKVGNIPDNIPTNPAKVYNNKWKNTRDWLIG